MKNKVVGFILIIIAFLLIISGVIINVLDKGKAGDNTTKGEDFGFVVENKYQDYTVEQQIALILASDYIIVQAVLENLKSVSYVDNTFDFEYIIKKTDDGFKEDRVEIKTEDFVLYTVYGVVYDGDTPNTISVSEYDGFLYTTRDMVYNLAKNNSYVVGETFDNEKMLAILEILKKSDVGEYIKVVEDNGYILRKYSAVPKDKITFIYEKGDGGYLNIYNVLNDPSKWNVYGVDSKELSKNYEYFDFISGYLIDKTISIDDNNYSELTKQIGTFLDQ